MSRLKETKEHLEKVAEVKRTNVMNFNEWGLGVLGDIALSLAAIADELHTVNNGKSKKGGDK